MAYTVKKYGIDISTWQPDPFPFSQFTNHFAILRAAYSYIQSGSLYYAFDDHFHNYRAQAQAAGVPTGMYYYLKASTATGGRNNANWVYNNLRQYQNEMPYGLWLDLEDPDIPTARAQAIMEAFFDQLINVKGYSGMVGLYTYQYYYDTYITSLPTGVKLWLANFNGTAYQPGAMTTPDVYIHQFTNVYHNFSGGLDGDALYGKVPSGGGGNASNPTLPGFSNSGKMSLDAYAWAVIEGEYGNGAARKKALGSRYEKVQARVNDLYKMAYQVIRGKYGNGEERKRRLGAEYEMVQKVVDHILKEG